MAILFLWFLKGKKNQITIWTHAYFQIEGSVL